MAGAGLLTVTKPAARPGTAERYVQDPFAPFRLDDRVAIITGASSGIGARLARVLRAAGATVIAAARRTDRLITLAGELGTGVRVVTCDVTTDEGRERLVAEAMSVQGHVDVLVNNAGVKGFGLPAENEPLAEFRRVLEVNLIAVFALSQLVGRHMLEAGSGSILNIASVAGLVGTGSLNQADYATSKGGVVNLTRDLASQWARRGVRVNAIAPGPFPTEMTETLFGDEQLMRWLRQSTPMGRVGEEHELDGPALFLASDASSYVTGQVLVVDGGLTAV